jgi:dienelactone hydrolase
MTSGSSLLSDSTDALFPEPLAPTTRRSIRVSLLPEAWLASSNSRRTQGVPLQIHMMEADEWVLEGDLDAARELERTIEGAELFLYPGDRHLFADNSLPDYDESAAALLKERVLAFLVAVG